ncbi:hypothetical protein DXT99_00770 [Pontibacter diazotrophicus]|uniref:Uncharacterized protein n=1 Tax=Pontibacter diazotrophicus TaxID=1400979 RepID=A0A3D8LI06_9BACT|nr:hypothetical protein [Pontibacter diazotrophicus]RDV17081.1 hypothetical protein DXT99_00770 [Pontibacter diazotrophicus]
MKFNAATPKLVDDLSAIVGAAHVLLQAAAGSFPATHDDRGLRYKPERVLRTANASGRGLIMAFRHENLLPIPLCGADVDHGSGAFAV